MHGYCRYETPPGLTREATYTSANGLQIHLCFVAAPIHERRDKQTKSSSAVAWETVPPFDTNNAARAS